MEKTKGKELKDEVQGISEKPDHQRSFVNIFKTQVFALSEARRNRRVWGRRVACSDLCFGSIMLGAMLWIDSWWARLKQGDQLGCCDYIPDGW